MKAIETLIHVLTLGVSYVVKAYWVYKKFIKLVDLDGNGTVTLAEVQRATRKLTSGALKIALKRGE